MTPALGPPPPRLAWTVWGLGALVYLIGFYQRVAPAVITDRLMADFFVWCRRARQPVGVLLSMPRRDADPDRHHCRSLGSAPPADRGRWCRRDRHGAVCLRADPLLGQRRRLLIGGLGGGSPLSRCSSSPRAGSGPTSSRWLPAWRCSAVSLVAWSPAFRCGSRSRLSAGASDDGHGRRHGGAVWAIWRFCSRRPGERGFASHALAPPAHAAHHALVWHGLVQVLSYRNTWILVIVPIGVAGAGAHLRRCSPGVPWLKQVHGLERRARR